jgi:hypothetical protein
MMRQRILNALLIASFGAMAATGAAQTAPTTPAQDNTPRNAPVGDTAAPPTAGTTGSTSGGTMAPSDSTIKAPGTAMDSSAPTSMSGYKAARAACDKQPLKDQCRTALNARYSAVSPQCQKLSGNALDDCLKGADTSQ